MSELRVNLEFLTEEAIKLRFNVTIPVYGAGPVELHQSLADVQQTLSTMEDYLSKVIRGKAALDRKENHLRMVWQEAFDKALTKKKNSLSGDFVSGKEKIADANLSAFEEARSLRLIQEDLSFANEAVDIVRLHYYGLDKIRQDIRKRLDMSQTDYYS